MKRLLFLLFLVSVSYSQTRTSIFKLPQWSTGDTLKAGTANDSAQSNFGLNNGFYRLETVLGRQMDSSGLFRFLYGRGTGNLTIDAGVGTATPQRIVLNDSLYGTYNWQTTGNLLVGGNFILGGYAVMDSVQLTSGTLFLSGGDITGVDDITGGSASYFSASTVYGADSLVTGRASASAGLIKLYTGSGLNEGRIQGGGVGVLTIPNQTGTIATIDGNQNFTNMGYAVVDSVEGVLKSDSAQSDNNYTVLYSDTKTAGTAAGDTSANFTTFLATTGGNETKVRITYLHRRGNANIKAYYQIRGKTSIAVGAYLKVYNLSGSEVLSAADVSTATTTYESDSVTLSVAGLTTNTLYELRFITYGGDASDVPEVKNLVIVATSN